MTQPWSEIERNETHVKYTCTNRDGKTCFGAVCLDETPHVLSTPEWAKPNELELGKKGYRCRSLGEDGKPSSEWNNWGGYEPKESAPAPVAPVFPAGSCQCCGHKGGAFFGVACEACFMKNRYL